MNGKKFLNVGDIPPEVFEQQVIGGARTNFIKMLDGLESLVDAWTREALNDKSFARSITKRLDELRRFIAIKKNGEKNDKSKT